MTKYISYNGQCIDITDVQYLDNGAVKFIKNGSECVLTLSQFKALYVELTDE